MRRTMVVAVSLIGTVGEAQTPVGAGVTVGVAQLSAARTEQVVTGVLQLRPRPWLALSAIPSAIRLSHDTSGATVASGGLGRTSTATFDGYRAVRYTRCVAAR